MTVHVGGIATRNGLDCPGVESQWEATFIAAIQTGPGVHPVSHTMGKLRLKHDDTRANQNTSFAERDESI
jgi:hypothetical protein